jgi:hypothetical protein
VLEDCKVGQATIHLLAGGGLEEHDEGVATAAKLREPSAVSVLGQVVSYEGREKGGEQRAERLKRPRPGRVLRGQGEGGREGGVGSRGFWGVGA